MANSTDQCLLAMSVSDQCLLMQGEVHGSKSQGNLFIWPTLKGAGVKPGLWTFGLDCGLDFGLDRPKPSPPSSPRSSPEVHSPAFTPAPLKVCYCSCHQNEVIENH